MSYPIKIMLFIAMSLLTVVSIYTTYASLNDSILPEPTVMIPLAGGTVWKCSVIALGLSVAIGMMLFALKMAIIGGQKRLNIFGILGMTIVAFISIVFNMDVLYRTADREFYLRYSNDRMRSTYEGYLAEVQGVLQERKTELLRSVAKQEGELDAETKGLRKAPAGYGQYAKEEDYKLTVLQKTAAVDLEALEQAMATKAQADDLLRTAVPEKLEDIDKTQAELRVIVKDLSGVSGVALPQLVKTESPLFAVFAKLMDIKTVGFKEIFFLMIAFFLDLGDIIGYTLVPNKKDKKAPAVRLDPFPAPRRLALVSGDGETAADDDDLPETRADGDENDEVVDDGERAAYPALRGSRRRPGTFRIGRR